MFYFCHPLVLPWTGREQAGAFTVLMSTLRDKTLSDDTTVVASYAAGKITTFHVFHVFRFTNTDRRINAVGVGV